MTRAFLCAVAVLLLLTGATTAPFSDPARTFLATVFKMTDADIGRVDAGHVVSRSVSARDPREVATLGVVRIRATPDFYVERLADVVNFKRDEAVLQIGTFRSPPHLDDVADLTLDPWDVRKLRECRVGACGVQLSAEAIERFRKDVDWRRADAELELQASRVMRQILVDYVMRYHDRGTTAFIQYTDNGEPLDLDREFRALVDADVETWQYFPDLRQHLLTYPTTHTPGTTDLVYWSKERVSRRVVVSITHLAISSRASGPAEYAIASKQIYGSHYFEASLGLTVLLRDQAAAFPAMYLVYWNRSRVDVFNGVFSGVARRIVNTRARSLVAEQLEQLQQSVEHQFAAPAR